MTNYAQPQGIENWPEDLRRRFLEAMKKRQLELSSQIVGGAMPYGGAAELSPAQIEKRKLNLQNLQNIRDLKSDISLEETGVSDEVKAYEQQERLQTLLNQASPATAAPPTTPSTSKGMNLSTPPADPAYLEMMRRGSELEPGYAGPSTFVPSRKTSPAASTDAGYFDETTVPRTQFMEPPSVSSPAGTWSPSEGGSAAVVEYPPVVTSVSGYDDPDKAPDAPVSKTTKVPPKNTSEYDSYMKSLWGRYASDPEARKKMYLSQLNKIYAKSMLLDGWAHVTGGESRGPAYAAAATDVLDKTEKFDSEIRLHNIWKAAMFKDGKYYPPKTIPDFYERLQALGATASEIAELTKGVSGKSFREQAALEATPKMGTYYDKAKGEAFDAYSDDPRVVKGLNDGSLRRISLQSAESIEGKKFTDQMREHGKRYRMATPTERAKILQKAVLALEHALLNQESLMFRLGQITQETFKTPEGKIKTVLKLMGINDPSGGRVEKVPQ
tara:strand:+ start:158 stop:1651 length:1494 start_codon:yes stop_codon:yes gene_type:complete